MCVLQRLDCRRYCLHASTRATTHTDISAPRRSPSQAIIMLACAIRCSEQSRASLTIINVCCVPSTVATSSQHPGCEAWLAPALHQVSIVFLAQGSCSRVASGTERPHLHEFEFASVCAASSLSPVGGPRPDPRSLLDSIALVLPVHGGNVRGLEANGLNNPSLH